MGLDYDKIDYSGIDFGNWNETDWELIRPGITRVVFGMSAKSLSCTIGEVKEGHETKPHTHPNEQVAIIIQGTCDYYVDGKPVRCKPGSWVVVPPNVEHYIHVFNSEEPVLNIDFFTPNRPEYTEVYTKFLNELKK
jgi:quercetin dioxygenase-like cupin family protein